VKRVSMATINSRVEQKQFDNTIVTGPLLKAVWKIAWPTMLQNVIAGLQGIVDHALVGHLVGYTGNAAIGVSWQIFLMVVVFISSLYSGMGIMVARAVGAGESEKVSRVVYQAFLSSILLACLILAPLGYFLSPYLLDLVRAEPAVKAEALPYLRTMLVFSFGMLIFFMLSGALRAAADAKTPLVMGIALTLLNLVLNVIFIRGLGPIPAFGVLGSGIGTAIASNSVALVGIYLLFSKRLVIKFSSGMRWLPDWQTISALFRLGLPVGFQGIAMNLAGILLLRFIGSLQQSGEAQAIYTVCYTELFSFITWTSIGLMGATSAVMGQNIGAGNLARAKEAVATAAKVGVLSATFIGLMFIFVPKPLLAAFGIVDPVLLDLGQQLLRYLSVSGLFITLALTFTGGLQGGGDTRSPFYISIISQIVVPLGLCAIVQSLRLLEPRDIWLAIVLGHFTRCTLSFFRFRQGKWASIKV
jgi:putative MATE family efflux protein